MKRAYLIVEGENDADLLRRVLLPEVMQDVEIVNANGAGQIPSLARSFLVRRRTPVAVLMDSDSLNPDVIDERQGGTEELIQMAAASIPVKVVVSVPELEVYFFAAPEVIERVLGEKVPTDMMPLGHRDPKGILEYLAKRSGATWNTSEAIKQLDSHDIERIRAVPAMSELQEFLRKVQVNGHR